MASSRGLMLSLGGSVPATPHILMGFRNEGYLIGVLIITGSLLFGVYFRGPLFS